MADGVIDSLSIEIGASSNNAVKNINALVNAMKALKDAASHIDNSAAGKISALASAMKELGDSKKVNISSKLGDNLSKLAGAMKAVKSEDISKLRQVASAVKTFDGVKNVNINSKLAQNIVDVASAVSLLEKSHFEKITQLGNALKALSGGNISISKTLSERLKEIAAAVDTISNDTLDKIRQLTKALARLKGMGDVKIRISGVGSASAGGNRGNNPLPSGAQNNGQQNSGGSSGSGQTGVKEQIQWTLSLKKNISLIAAEWSKVGQAISSAIPGPLKLVLSVIGGIAKGVWNVAKGIAKWAFNTALSVVKRIASAVKSIAKGVVDVGKNLVKNWYDRSIFKSLADEFERIKKILSTFGRIAFYRAVRSAIKYVTDALQQGAENAYWYSKKFGEATKYISQAYDQMSSSNFKMSNQLGAAWSTLIATIEPIIIQIINLVTRAAAAVTQFFAVLGGKTVYMKAIDYSKDWADETEKGNKAAKEWKNQLMGFDEINRLEAPSDNGISGQTDKYTDYENMFEEADVSGFFKKIRDMIDSNQWGELGTMLGKKFNQLLDSIDFAGWGKKIGKGIQNAIDLAYNFLGENPFGRIGNKISAALNNLGDQVNFEQFGRLSRRISLALWNMLYGAVTTLDWKAWAGRISDYIIGSLNELADWLSKLDPSKIAKAIKDFFGNIKYSEIRDSFLSVIKVSWEKAIELRNEIFNDETKEKVKTAIVNFFGGMTWEDVSKKIKEKLTSAWTFVTDRFDEIWPPESRENFKKAAIRTLNNLLQGAISSIDFEALKNVLGFKLGSAVFGEEWGKEHYGYGEYAGSELIQGMIYGVGVEAPKYRNTFEAYVSEPTKESLDSLLAAVQTNAEAMYGEIDESFKDCGASASGLSYEFANLKGDIETESNSIKDSANSVASSFGSLVGEGTSAFSSLATAAITAANPVIGSLLSIRNAAVEAWSWLRNVFVAEQHLGGTTISGNYGGSHYSGKFASGGFPEDGFFYANHGELVGQFSNGKTAVANNEQIVDGIRQGVFEAVSAALSMQDNSRDERPTEVRVYLDSREIKSGQRRLDRAMGVG